MGCHQTIAADRPSIQKLAEFAASGKPVPWVRVYQVPDYVFWQHGSHLEAKVDCAECHGPVAERDVITLETNVVKMLGCVTCHDKRQAFTDCGACHAPRQNRRAMDPKLSAHASARVRAGLKARPYIADAVNSVQPDRRRLSMRERTVRVVAGILAGAVAAAFGAGGHAQSGAAETAAGSREWPTYGHDPGGMRFSPLTQLTPANVDQLQVAWAYHMKPAASPTDGRAGAPAAGGANAPVGDTPPPAAQGRGRGRGGSGFASSEVTPLVINGTMYLATPYYRVVAIDATTGKEAWTFQLPSGNPSTRGVEYWPGDAQTPPQIVFGSSDARLYSLDAKTGKPNEAFGDKGAVDLNTPEILQGLPGRNGLSSPPIVYKNLVITGGTTQENPPRGPAGDVRAWDMHTGKLVWTFRSVPRAGDKHVDTWAGDSWKNRSGVNVWGFLTVDASRGIVYMPFGAPSVDQYGGDRAGRQPVRQQHRRGRCEHGQVPVAFPGRASRPLGRGSGGIAPALIDVKQGGKTIPAVAVDR